MNPDAKQATKITAKRVEKHPRSNLSCNKLGYCRLRKVVAVSTLCHKICSCCTFYLPMIRVWSDSHIIYQIRRLYSCIFHQPDLLHDRFERGWQNTWHFFSLFLVLLHLYTVYPSPRSQLWILTIRNWSMSKERNVWWKRQITLLSMRALACFRLRESRVHEIEKAWTRK